ncbi:MAG: hypothetical protein V1737_04510, partial [Chloroflexota bacterium]
MIISSHHCYLPRESVPLQLRRSLFRKAIYLGVLPVIFHKPLSQKKEVDNVQHEGMPIPTERSVDDFS